MYLQYLTMVLSMGYVIPLSVILMCYIGIMIVTIKFTTGRKEHAPCNIYTHQIYRKAISEPRTGQYYKFKSTTVLSGAKGCQNGGYIGTSIYRMLDAISAEKFAKCYKLAAETRRLQPTWWLYFWVTKISWKIQIEIANLTSSFQTRCWNKLVTHDTELLEWLLTLCWIQLYTRFWAQTFVSSVANCWRK